MSTTERTFRTVGPGVETCILRKHDGKGITYLVRMQKGASSPAHGHPDGEETYIVSGTVRIGGRRLVAGDYLYTPPGESHDGHAEETALFFVIAPGGIVPT